MGLQSQMINIGSGPDSGDGDTVRTAFSKLNSNLNEYDVQISRVMCILAVSIVYTNSATPQDVIIVSDATAGDSLITLVAADDADAKPTICCKKDASGNICNFRTPIGTPLVITGISKATEASIAADHSLSVGDAVVFSGNSGMTEINGLIGTVTTVTGSASFTVDINSTEFTTWSTGGSPIATHVFIYSVDIQNMAIRLIPIASAKIWITYENINFNIAVRFFSFCRSWRYYTHYKGI